MRGRVVDPRPVRVVNTTTGHTAKAWSYQNARSLDVVVEVKDPFGNYLTTTTIRIPAPRRARRKG